MQCPRTGTENPYTLLNVLCEGSHATWLYVFVPKNVLQRSMGLAQSGVSLKRIATLGQSCTVCLQYVLGDLSHCLSTVCWTPPLPPSHVCPPAHVPDPCFHQKYGAEDIRERGLQMKTYWGGGLSTLLPASCLQTLWGKRVKHPSAWWGKRVKHPSAWVGRGLSTLLPASCLQIIPFDTTLPLGGEAVLRSSHKALCCGCKCAVSHIWMSFQFGVLNFGSEWAWVIKSENSAVYTIQINSTRTSGMKILQALLDYGREANWFVLWGRAWGSLNKLSWFQPVVWFHYLNCRKDRSGWNPLNHPGLAKSLCLLRPVFWIFFFNFAE